MDDYVFKLSDNIDWEKTQNVVQCFVLLIYIAGICIIENVSVADR